MPSNTVAIIGIGCRFPGNANTPQQFWHLLCEGVDAIVEIPRERFDVDAVFDPKPGRPGKMYTRWAGLVDAIDRFDADFFGIAPREAPHIDPQQRLLLEVMWEALEDAGQMPEHLAGSKTGVFIGISSHDYGTIQIHPANRHILDGHSSTGGTNSIAANRLSYLFDLRGPSLAVDTACSSGLTATHLACRSLASGECDLAIVGGVNLILTPEVIVGFCQANLLSPDGRCRAFDSRANGFVRAEGAGVVVLKPLAQAREAGDRIYAVIRGSSVNQDGRTPGLMMPSGAAQQELLRQVLRDTGIAATDIQYVEAHGTGTAVGDPIEATAIGTVLGTNRPPDEPLLIGSAKTNIGHLEAAAGIAGLIKAALALQHRQIPPNLHFLHPNPTIPFADLRLRVPTHLEPWPRTSGAAMAGVNAFGFGGANAHVLLQEPPPPADVSPDYRAPAHILPLSARTPEALRELAARYVDHLREAKPDALEDICYTAALRRTHHAERLAVVGSGPDECADHLAAFLAGDDPAAVAAGRHRKDREPKLAFVFTGMGPQWWAMGRGLMAAEPRVRRVLEECNGIMRPLMGSSLLDEFSASQAESHVDEPRVVQVTNCALQIALIELWRAWGIVPDAVVGHSAGEVAAAYAAGILTLSDALLISFHRGLLCQSAMGTGTMLAVSLSAEEVATAIGPYLGRVSIAAFNSPTSIALSGERGALEEIDQTLQRQGRFSRFVATTVPYHGPQMDVVRDRLVEALRDLRPRTAAIPIVSEVTGHWADGHDFDAAYWGRHIRQPVLFAAAIDRLLDAGHDLFVEVGPHPALAVSIMECLASRSRKGIVLPTLRRMEDEPAAMRRTLAALYAYGRGVHWAGLYPSGRCVTLPTYPWQRERYWFSSAAQEPVPQYRSAGTDTGHPLLGRRLRSVRPTWEADLGRTDLAYLDDHSIEHTAVFPGAAYVETMLAAARELGFGDDVRLEDIEFRKILFLPHRDDVLLQSLHDPARSSIEIHAALKKQPSGWTLHATARLRRSQVPTPAPLDVQAITARCAQHLSPETQYAAFAARGLQFRESFRCVSEVKLGEAEALIRIELAAPVAAQARSYQIHPCLLDAAFQALLGPALSAANALPQERTCVVTSLRRLDLHARLGDGPFWAHARLRHADGAAYLGDVWLANDDGTVILTCEGLRVTALDREGPSAHKVSNEGLYRLVWEQASLRVPAGPRTQALPTPSDVRGALRSRTGEGERQQESADYYALIEPRLSRLASRFALAALDELGWDRHGSPEQSVDSAVLSLGVVPRHRLFFARLVEIVRADRFCADATVEPGGPAGTPHDLADALLAAHPEYEAIIVPLCRSGERLAQVVRGETDAREILFSPEAIDILAALYETAPPTLLYNTLAAEALSAATQRIPADMPLRVLEIGAGMGGATSAVLPRLRPGSLEYVFTDVSPFFLDRAEQRFGGRAGLRFALLDIEQDPLGQHVEAQSFDIVLAANVLHGTADLSVALRHIQRLLRPGGLLVVEELTRRSPWLDVIFGGLDGWWRFTDTRLRPSHPLLGAGQWQSLLEEIGFDDVVRLAEPNQEGETLQTVFLARTRVGSQRWLLFADRGGVGARLAAALEAQGASCTLAYTGERYLQRADSAFEIRPQAEDDVARLIDAWKVADSARHGLIHLWSLDAPPPDAWTAAGLMAAQRIGCGSVLDIVHAVQRSGPPAPELWLITAGSQDVDDEHAPVNAAQAPLWGLAHVVMSEEPGLRCRLVDLSPSCPDEELAALVDEVQGDDFEAEVALRGTRRLAQRVQQASMPERGNAAIAHEVPAQTATFRVEIVTPGVLETLALVDAPPPRPAPGEVLIRTVAAGLNFKDVLLALGELPSAETSDQRNTGIGVECTGLVLACGDGVEDLCPGDEVVALGYGRFASHVIAPAHLVARKPAGLRFEEAATLPTAFVTAHYALNHLARIAPGERVLIHAAAGGVGHAAIQICRRAGAQIFATAGTPEKRVYLRSLGIEHVMDSRSLAFADEVLDLTQGDGVDVVLNSLAGEAIEKGLRVLRVGGRFVEIGKRDILADASLGLLPFARGLAFFAVDIDLLARERQALVGSLLRAVMTLVEEGAAQPLPYTTFDVSEVERAYRLMVEAKHVGKVVLTHRQSHYRVKARHQAGTMCHPDATYLITGGLGGFGLATAHWLVRQGARHLVLMSRSGVPKDDPAVLQDLLNSPAEIVLARGDIGSEQDLDRVLAHIRTTMPPLRGVIHAAMVLDEDILLRLNHDRLARAMHCKVAGTWNLHSRTLVDDLDFFVLYSSISSVVGHPLQGNYAAANAFLDAFAACRRALGLPGLTINWGALTGAGYLFRHPDFEEHLLHAGLQSFSAEWALDRLPGLLNSGLSQVIVARMNWREWVQRHQGAAALRRYVHVIADGNQPGSRPAGDTSSSLHALLQDAATEGRRALLLDYIAGRAAKVLGSAARKVALDRPLTEMGIDSLMAVELISALRAELGIQISVVQLLQGVSIEGLTDMVLAQLALQTRAAEPAQPEVVAPAGQPLSFEQRRLWFLQHLDPDSRAYNIPLDTRVRGPLKIGALERSLNEAVRRHEILRTGFVAVDGEPMQVVAPSVSLRLPLMDLSRLTAEEQEAEVQRLARSEFETPFDLSRPPLLRATILRLSATEHVVLMTMHHLICDSTIGTLLLREIAALYEAFVGDNPSPLPEPDVQYRDYVRWQQQRLRDDATASHLAYWRRQLECAPTTLHLPVDRMRSAARTPRGGSYRFAVPDGLAAALRDLSRREGVTLFMTLLAAFQALLHRYTDDSDICVGTPILTRSMPGAQSAFGCFMNTLVMRTDLSGDPTFRELLQRVREVALGAFAHQEVPFDRVVEALRPERHPEHMPLFQVMLILHGPSVGEMTLADLTAHPLEYETGISLFDLTLFFEVAEGLTGRLVYSTDLFEAATVARMAGHLTTLLAGVVGAPDCPLSRLPLLPADEHRLLQEWSARVADLGPVQCLHELVEAQVERTPNALALVFEQGHLTYRDLDRRANRLANRLRRLGVGPDDLVAVCAHPSVELVAATLAVLKAGAAFVPLDPTDPPYRLAILLADAQPRVLLAQAESFSTLPADGAARIALDTSWEALAAESADRPCANVTPDHLAYVMYTSGSTGQPKGVMVPHRAICNQLRWRQQSFPLTLADAVLQRTPSSFDPAVWEFFGTLSAGARLVLPRAGGHRDPAYLVALMAQQDITTLQVVPSVLDVLLAEPAFRACRSLSRVFCGGETLTSDLVERFHARSSATLCNLYGPTETAIDATSWTCDRDDCRQTVPIGRSIANAEVYIVDAHMQPVPIGVPGELLIGGAGLARGYLNRPDLTAERFIPNPFGDAPGARLYRTGDLARYLPDGTMEFCGRRDDQVKIRGRRVELGEIEAALVALSPIREAVVMLTPRDEDSGRLVAYVVADTEDMPADIDLRRLLGQHLPASMVPTAFARLAALPRLPNGKVDRSALHPPQRDQDATPEPERAAPRDRFEAELAHIWESLLDIPAVGITDDFFDLGGHSLLAVHMLAQIEANLGIVLPLSCVFAEPTIAQLARVLREQPEAHDHAPS